MFFGKKMNLNQRIKKYENIIYLEYLKVKDLLAINLKEIVEKNKASFAFPSTSIYVEKNT